jgi:23S rRNA (uracil1939-C5)-methyltransferase
VGQSGEKRRQPCDAFSLLNLPCYRANMKTLALTVGDRIEVKTERLAYGGEAIAHFQGLAIFVQGGAPDETLGVRITERKKRYARAVIEEIINPSPMRRVPPCKYFGECGGCQLQHINYENQLAAKVEFLRDALKRTGQIDWTEAIKIHSASEFNYRLRAKIKVERDKFNRQSFNRQLENIERNSPGDQLRIGFNQANSHTVCDIEHCEILLPELNEALKFIRASLPSDHKSSSQSTDEIEIAVSDVSDAGTRTLNARPRVSSSPPLSGFSTGEVQRKVAGAVYQFSPSDFFQVNALLLDEFVKAAVGTEKGDFALDLFAGVGLFTIHLARHFKCVIGVESNSRAVDFANKNISLNEARNTTVICSRVDSWLKNFISQQTTPPDLVLLDPPRSGAVEALDLIAKLKPAQIHYVSCDPVTLARDLKQLIARHYKIERLVAFDMFPQTYHVETIAFLKLR